ncbi:MAG: PD-(D/E)XK nuclease family protein [Prochlorotrichaceae cyanobacterium]|jgi:hypothetical protein
MVETEIRNLIQRELPRLIAEEPGIRDFILRTVSEYYTPRDEFSDRFDRILAELQRDREEQRLKWEEQRLERERDREEQRLERDALLTKVNRRYDSTIGALGSRWGLYSEASFRNGLKAILGESFGVEVLNFQENDPDGEVFGRPDQVEIDVIIKNGLVILCELKSSISKAEMYVFDRKAAFYQKRYQRSVNRKIVISPMVDSRALPVAQQLGIEVYSYADDLQV